MSHSTVMKAGSLKERVNERQIRLSQKAYSASFTNQEEPGARARRALFETSRRHSAGVKRLRAWIIVSSAILILLLSGLVFFNPLKHLPKNITMGDVQVNGTKVIVNNPKIAGLQQNGLPFEITARSGTEDILNPNIVQLSGMKAKITLADLSHLEVLAKNGIYDNQTDQVMMQGDVRILNRGNYTIAMSQASLNFKTNVFYSDKFDFMQTQDGKISSDTITISHNGDRISFDGSVKSTFDAVSSKEDE